MKFTFGVRHTKNGCTVWMDAPSGRRSEARFRNTCYAAALTRAENWVWEERQALLAVAEETGREVEFEVPPELDRTHTIKQVSIHVDLLDSIEKAAKSARLSVGGWMIEAAKEKLSRDKPSAAEP